MEKKLTDLILALMVETMHPKNTSQDVVNITQAIVNLYKALELARNI